MAQIDQTFVFGTTGHAGNPQGSPGTNPKGPADAPIIGQKVVVGTQLNKTVGSTKIVNPACPVADNFTAEELAAFTPEQRAEIEHIEQSVRDFLADSRALLESTLY